MKRVQFSILIWLLFISIAGGLLMQVSFAVETKERELKKISQQRDTYLDSLKVLRAEWAYLTQPQRLSQLNEKYLHMQPQTLSQVIAARPDTAIATGAHKSELSTAPMLRPTPVALQR